MRPGPRRRVAVLSLALLLTLAAFPGLAAAEARAGGTVIVGVDETVDGLQVAAGTVIVHGTVEGDLRAAAGTVLVDGTVTGDVEAVAGNVRIDGRVGGDVSAAGGNVLVDRNAVVGGSVDASAGNVIVGGVVAGDVRAAAGSVILAPSASIRGDVSYAVGESGRFANRGAAVDGTITRNEGLAPDVFRLPEPPASALAVFGFVVNLLLGAFLLVVLPGLSAGVAERAVDRPVRMAAIGLLALVAAPIVLFLLAITIVGLPFALAGIVLLGVVLWVGSVYGRLAVGVWVTGLAGIEDRWIALVAGLLVIGVLGRLPWVGWVFAGVALVLGLGALAAVAAGRARRRPGARA